MNGARSLIQSLVKAGIEVCFANPGTSEMHLVQAMDAEPEFRGVLCLFEGVCTGAADGYARIAGKPAVTLLHLGPGLGNGIANLHNARRAGSPIINLVGNHTQDHEKLDAPLTSDIETLAKNVSRWIKTDSTAESLAADGLAAVSAVMQKARGSKGQIATLIIPADACWGPVTGVAPITVAIPSLAQSNADFAQIAERLTASSLILLDKDGLLPAAREAAAKIAKHVGCRVAMTAFPARIDSGPGSPVIERLPYFPEQVQKALHGVDHILLAGASEPVSFFAYPETPSKLAPADCERQVLAEGHQDVVLALQSLMTELQSDSAEPDRYQAAAFEVPTGKLTTRGVATMIAQQMPEGSILCGDSGGGAAVLEPAQQSSAHTWLNLTGGSIGQGGPAAIGAAIAAPNAQVFALLGDGASMYTIQALWTQARECLAVITVIFNNQRYGILETEYLRLGVNEIGQHAGALFALTEPNIQFADLASSLGVPGHRVDSCEAFQAVLAEALQRTGPTLIEVML